jgi:hypothetical protein
VKFEAVLFIKFERKTMPNKNRHFSWAMAHPFLKRRVLKSFKRLGAVRSVNEDKKKKAKQM